MSTHLISLPCLIDFEGALPLCNSNDKPVCEYFTASGQIELSFRGRKLISSPVVHSFFEHGLQALLVDGKMPQPGQQQQIQTLSTWHHDQIAEEKVAQMKLLFNFCSFSQAFCS